MFDKICLILVIIGALNWGLVGLFEFDLVAWAFGGATAVISRIIYTVIALAGIWCISCCSEKSRLQRLQTEFCQTSLRKSEGPYL